jgi:hypothetical protein
MKPGRGGRWISVHGATPLIADFCRFDQPVGGRLPALPHEPTSMTSAHIVLRGQDWWRMGWGARINQKLRACHPAVSPHQAPCPAAPKNRENRETAHQPASTQGIRILLHWAEMCGHRLRFFRRVHLRVFQVQAERQCKLHVLEHLLFWLYICGSCSPPIPAPAPAVSGKAGDQMGGLFVNEADLGHSFALPRQPLGHWNWNVLCRPRDFLKVTNRHHSFDRHVPTCTLRLQPPYCHTFKSPGGNRAGY